MRVTCPCGVTVERKPCLVKSGRAKYCSPACRARYSARRGEDHPNWKGDAVGYAAIHDWVDRQRPKPEACEWCGKVAALDWANLSYEYRRDISDWAALCRTCHVAEDKQRRYERNPTCHRGHPFDEANTHYVNGNRRCRACARENQRTYRERQAA